MKCTSFWIPISTGLRLGAHVRVPQLVVEDVDVLAAGVLLEDLLHLLVVDVVDLLLVVVKVPVGQRGRAVHQLEAVLVQGQLVLLVPVKIGDLGAPF